MSLVSAGFFVSNFAFIFSFKLWVFNKIEI